MKKLSISILLSILCIAVGLLAMEKRKAEPHQNRSRSKKYKEDPDLVGMEDEEEFTHCDQATNARNIGEKNKGE